MRQTGIFLTLLMLAANCGETRAGEVLSESRTAVLVREHPQTGQPYASVTKTGVMPRKIFQNSQKKFKRPDYRMLDPHVSPKSVGYDGPVSDRTKVYVLAGSLAAAGAAAYALPTAAAAGSAAGGAGMYAAAGAGVAAGTLSTHWAMSRSDGPDDFKHASLSREIKI